MIRVSNITVDDDEGRYVLHIVGDDGEILWVDIHGVVLDFYASVQREIRPYVLEAEAARTAVATGTPMHVYLGTAAPADEQADGYELNDPKHPTFYERMVD